MVWHYDDYYGMIVKICIIYNRHNVNFYRCFPTFSVSPFLQFFLLGRSMDWLGQENLSFLQPDFNFKVTWHFRLFLYLEITNRNHVIYIINILDWLLLVCTTGISVVHRRFSGTNPDCLLCKSFTGWTIEVYKVVQVNMRCEMNQIIQSLWCKYILTTFIPLALLQTTSMRRRRPTFISRAGSLGLSLSLDYHLCLTWFFIKWTS